MKKVFKFTLFIVICTLSLLLVGCNNESSSSDICKKYNKYFESSINSCKQVTLDYSVSDENVVIYDSFVKAKFNNEGCDVSVKESKLNSKYVLESDENSYTLSEYNKKDYVNVNFDENYIRSFEENEELKLSIKKFYFCDFIGISDLPINSISDVVVKTSNESIESIVASFVSDSSKDVTITITFVY